MKGKNKNKKLFKKYLKKNQFQKKRLIISHKLIRIHKICQRDKLHKDNHFLLQIKLQKLHKQHVVTPLHLI